MTLITCQDVSFGYDGNTVVSGLNFEVQSGDYLCIAGENGSGKSTLINGILQLKAPQTGRILTGGGLKPDEIGYLPQHKAAQTDFPASVYEVVLSGRLGARGFMPFYTGKDRVAANENMERLGIIRIKHSCFRELSGGQQQRVLLARALCAAKRAILLDEPAAGLDPLAAQELYSLIEKENREKGLTVIMVSHDLQNAIRYASHILHLKDRQAFFGTVEEYLKTDTGRAFTGNGGNGND